MRAGSGKTTIFVPKPLSKVYGPLMYEDPCIAGQVKGHWAFAGGFGKSLE